jgi:hypothetical protein
MDSPLSSLNMKLRKPRSVDEIVAVAARIARSGCLNLWNDLWTDTMGTLLGQKPKAAADR